MTYNVQCTFHIFFTISETLWLGHYFACVFVHVRTPGWGGARKPLCKWTAIRLKYWSRLGQVDVTQTMRVCGCGGREGFFGGASPVTDHISTDISVNNRRSSGVKLLSKVWSDVYTACNFFFASSFFIWSTVILINVIWMHLIMCLISISSFWVQPSSKMAMLPLNLFTRGSWVQVPGGGGVCVWGVWSVS